VLITEMQCVYDLWHGTIESQDGALQLLQIVDHIWTWARDIYRPGIRTCLQTVNNREVSPASTVQFYGTPSIRSDSIPLSIRNYDNTASGQFHNTFQRDQTASVYTSEHVSRSRQRFEAHSIRNQSAKPSEDVRDVIFISDEEIERVGARPGVMSYHQSPRAHPERASIPAHPILRWADLHRSSVVLSTFATVSHANIARYRFYIRDITDFEIYLSITGSEYARKDRWQLMCLYPISIQVSRETLSRFESFWTERIHEEPVSSPDEIVRATIFFHTYLEQTNWRIVKEILCVIWPTEIVDEDMELVQIDSIVTPSHAITFSHLSVLSHPLKKLSGSQSVLCAHNNYILLPFFDHGGYSWKTPGGEFPSETGLKACISLLKDDALFAFSKKAIRPEDTGPITLASTETLNEASESLPDLPDTMNQVNSLIAIKPTSWPMRTPKFCLFVLQEENLDSAKTLTRLLKDAVLNENMIGHRSEFLLTKEEQEGMTRWQMLLGEMVVDFSDLAMIVQ
jgi:hypothetical protein